MDKVEDFVEGKCCPLNYILKLFPRPGLFPKKVCSRSSLVFPIPINALLPFRIHENVREMFDIGERIMT